MGQSENRIEQTGVERQDKGGEREVAKAKHRAYEVLYDMLDTKEGEKDLYRLATQRNQAGKEQQQGWKYIKCLENKEISA